jgi:phospholipid/cholesterol/gamma-HCH transport system substrate-binding protein
MTEETQQRRRSGPSDQQLAAAVPKDGSVRLVLIGAFVILGIISVFAVLFLTTDPATLRGRYMLVTELQDAGGVRKGDPIQMRGVNIGRVHNFEMTEDGRVTITLEIEGEWRIPRGSEVTLAEAGIFGGRTVKILPGTGPELLAEYDTVPGQDGGGGMFAMAERVGDEAEVLLTRLSMLLDTTTVRSVQGSTREVESVARSLREVLEGQRDELVTLTGALSRTVQQLETTTTEAGPDVAAAAAHASELLGRLEGTTERFDAVLTGLDTVLGRMARGEGTLGRLSTDASLYDGLSAAVASLDLLLIDVRENPDRYVKIEIF